LVSTDPAHSLGDAWRTSFSNVPSSPIENLDVMELDPSEMMENELATWVQYAKEFKDESNKNEASTEESSIATKINSFQEWISGIPGIDEATALSAAITHIESGKYDIIVFDTAPTGHTLKLLALPEILEQGIVKLQSWQTTIWTYWDAFKGLTSGVGASQAMKKNKLREEISEKMTNYKQSIQKVAQMLQDQDRTRFVVVCIAEFLSVSETRRLLQELEKNKVRVSHIIVNQLVVEDTLSLDELNELETLAEVGNFDMNQNLLRKTIHTCRLTSSRKKIQQKYLGVLKEFEETQTIIEGICELPLMAEEVTGSDAILKFAKKMIGESSGDDWLKKSTANTPSVGDIVRLAGLDKNDTLNGMEGTVISEVDTVTGRCGVSIETDGKKRKLALLPKNVAIVQKQQVIGEGHQDSSTTQKEKDDNQEQKVSSDKASAPDDNSSTAVSAGMMTKVKSILEDPEIKAMIDQEPRVKSAIEDCLQNPMNFMKYMSDPVLQPFLMKAMNKL
jgi:arsenite-transporting ATPase